MKNAALKKYLEENPDGEELINTITLLEDFTGWEFSVRKCICNGVSIYIFGIESCSAPDSTYVLLKTSSSNIYGTAVAYFKEPFGPPKTILNMLHVWFKESLLTLNESETSIRMKMQLRGLNNKQK